MYILVDKILYVDRCFDNWRAARTVMRWLYKRTRAQSRVRSDRTQKSFIDVYCGSLTL